MYYFNLSSSQKMLLFSEIKNPNNDSFYLKFKIDYKLEDFEYLKTAIEIISKNSLNLQITKDTNGDFKQYYLTDSEVDIKSFDVTQDELESFIEEYLDKPFEDILDSPLYSWVILKTDKSAILIGAVQHILLDGTSLYTILPQQIESIINSLKNNEEYQIKKYSYEDYVNSEIKYLRSSEAQEDKQYWLNSLKNYTQDWYSFDNSRLGSVEVLLDQIPDFNYSPFIIALSLSFLYLSKSKNNNNTFKDIIMNTSVHGRYFNQNDALGMFVNTIPLRLTYDDELSFEELLAYSKSILKAGLSHAKLQFSEYTTDLRNDGIDPDCISMYSIVSNSTTTNSKFLTLQKDINFPLHTYLLEGLILPVSLAVILSSVIGVNGIWISFSLAELITILFIYAYSRYKNKQSNGEYSGFFINKSNDNNENVLEYTLKGEIEEVVELSKNRRIFEWHKIRYHS